MPTAFAFNTERQHAQRQRVLMEACGVYAETVPLNACQNAVAGGSGTVYAGAIGLLAGDVVTNLSVRCNVGGTGVTLAKLALYSKTGTLLASTADASSSFNSAGVKTLPVLLASGLPFTVPADDGYYAAFLGVTGTTMPTLLRGMGNFAGTAHGPLGTGMASQLIQAAQADLPSPATLVASTAGNNIWIGVS